MQNFEPTGAAAAMPGSAVPQIKRRLVISACLLIPLFYLGLGAAFGLPLPPFLTGDNAIWSWKIASISILSYSLIRLTGLISLLK